MIIFWLSCCYSFIVVHDQYRRSNHKLVIKNRLSNTWNIKKLRICGTFRNGSHSLQRQYEIRISIYHDITWLIISLLNKSHVIRGLKRNWHNNVAYKKLTEIVSFNGWKGFFASTSHIFMCMSIIQIIELIILYKK